MSIFKFGKKIKKKYEILWGRIEKANPEIFKEFDGYLTELVETWKRVSPFIGEEDAYGTAHGFELTDKMQIKGSAMDFLLWFVLFKKISEKIDKELKWLKDNREFLDLIVKDYIKEQIKPQKKKEPPYRT